MSECSAVLVFVKVLQIAVFLLLVLVLVLLMMLKTSFHFVFQLNPPPLQFLHCYLFLLHISNDLNKKGAAFPWLQFHSIRSGMSPAHL